MPKLPHHVHFFFRWKPKKYIFILHVLTCTLFKSHSELPSSTTILSVKSKSSSTVTGKCIQMRSLHSDLEVSIETQPGETFVPLHNLKYTQAAIDRVFGEGSHAGERIERLVQSLDDGSLCVFGGFSI